MYRYKMKLLEGYNWVYTIHVFLVAPLLLLVPFVYLFKEKYNFSESLIKSLMYLLIGFGVTVFLYHGNKLRKILM